MARVTVEDCVLKVPNRFDLVLLSSQRAREIGSGSALTVDRDNDKNPVVALREIAEETVSLGTLHEALVKSHQKVIEFDEEDEEIIDVMEGESGEWAAVAGEGTLERDGFHEDFGDEEAEEEDVAAAATDMGMGEDDEAL